MEDADHIIARLIAENWESARTNKKNADHELKAFILANRKKYKMTDIAKMTGIKRTTLYYLISSEDKLDRAA